MLYAWKPIENLPDEPSSLTDDELGPLLQFWNGLKDELTEKGVLSKFSTELAREWSIETGQIEGIYDLDRGVTRTLIERGFDADRIPHAPGQKNPELIAAIIRDHADVLEGLFDFIKSARPLSKSYINELHAALLQNQPTATVKDQFSQLFEAEILKGTYKRLPNNPTRADGTVHPYCPPEHVESEMQRLIEMHAEHQARGVAVEVQSAWLHHRFTQIHPYQDGNGRVARAIASLLFMKTGWFPVVVSRDDRTRYIDALEVADEGDLRSLVSLFVDIQKRGLFQATKAAIDVIPANNVDAEIQSIKRVLVGAEQSLEPSVWLRAKDTADHLIMVAQRRLQEVADVLATEIAVHRPDFSFSVSTLISLKEPESLGFGYVRGIYDQTIKLLLIRSEAYDSICIQAHAIGSKFRGLIGIVAFFAPASSSNSPLTSSEVFQVNYAESRDHAEHRFRAWLEGSLVRALALWRQSL